MNISLPDKGVNILIDSLRCWISHYDERGWTSADVALGANMLEAVEKAVGKVIDTANNPTEDEEEKHPEFVREANPGERFVYGKGYVKKDEKK